VRGRPSDAQKNPFSNALSLEFGDRTEDVHLKPQDEPDRGRTQTLVSTSLALSVFTT
jgi:hypothetical protein